MAPIISKFFDALDRLDEAIVVICMAGIAALTFIAVIARYVFSMPIAGADELATILFVWAALFGASAAFKYNMHGGVPILVDCFPGKVRRVLDLAVLSLMAGFFAFLSFQTFLFAQRTYHIGQTSPATGIPSWVINAGIFLALVICGVRCVLPIVNDLRGRPRFKEAPVANGPT